MGWKNKRHGKGTEERDVRQIKGQK